MANYQEVISRIDQLVLSFAETSGDVKAMQEKISGVKEDTFELKKILQGNGKIGLIGEVNNLYIKMRNDEKCLSDHIKSHNETKDKENKKEERKEKFRLDIFLLIISNVIMLIFSYISIMTK